jgi:exonuclease VII large subunit
MSFSIFVIDAKLNTKALNDEKIKERKLTIAKKMIQDVAKDYMIAKQTLEDLTKDHEPTKKRPSFEDFLRECEDIFNMMERNINENIIEQKIKNHINKEEIKEMVAGWAAVKHKNPQTYHKLVWCLIPAFQRKLCAIEKKLQRLKTLMERASHQALLQRRLPTIRL